MTDWKKLLANAGEILGLKSSVSSQGFDKRALSADPLDAPDPLPYVSRKALKRVKDVLPIPNECRYCGDHVYLVSNAEIYRGREFGEWPYVYWCEVCDAYVGLHPNTDLPLGTLANKELREARKSGKSAFIRLQKNNGWSRDLAYSWLSERMGMPKNECHWGWFEIEQCATAERLCKEALGGQP